MASSIALLALIVAACAVTAAESRALPDALPVPMVVDIFDAPIAFVRGKRSSYPGYPGYPQSTMMFTGFYRPTRHSASSGGVYAQGNSVGGGGAYFGRPQYLKDGPEPIDEPEVSSADALAAPLVPEDVAEEEQQEHEQQQPERRPEQEETTTQIQDTEDTEIADPASEEPIEPAQKQPTQKHPSRGQTKKGKKIPIPAPEEDDEEYEDDEEEAISPFIPPRPGKGGRRNKNYPSLNNYFPMVFTFPRGAGRGTGSAGGAGSPPGLIAAIANSYSTGKGGVASSVATAYGGAPTKKQRRIPTTE